jgi:hypothetical protein
MQKNLFHNKFYFMPLHVSSTCVHHQEVKIALHSLWYHHTYRCDDTRGYIIQFWPPDDKHMCSKHVEARYKLIVKQKFCASSWLITEINILRCTVSKTSEFPERYFLWLAPVPPDRYPWSTLNSVTRETFQIISNPFFTNHHNRSRCIVRDTESEYFNLLQKKSVCFV